MANAKWIKWATGLAGVLMFSGFVGYLSKGEQQEGTTGSAGLVAGSVQDNQADGGQGDIADQWQNDVQNNDSGSGTDNSAGGGQTYEGRGGFGGGPGRGGFVQGGDQGQSGSGDTDSDGGSFRTRAS